MKRKIICALCLFISFWMFAGQAGASDIKIGVIDANRIVQESAAGNKARTVLNKEIETKQAAYSAREKDVQAMKEEILSLKAEKKTEEYNKKSVEYSKAAKELSRMKSDLEDELKVREAELRTQLLSDISIVLSDFCKKEKYAMIVQKSYVAAFDTAIDVTDKIIQLYDASREASK